MKGLILRYKPKDENARVLLNHTLYGRLLYKNYRGRKYAYYVQGELDDRKFTKLGRGGAVFITKYEDKLDFWKDLFSVFGEMEFTETNMDIEPEKLITGEEYWKGLADAKDLPFKKRKTRGIK